MKVLWICNQIPVFCAKELGIPAGNGGGWMERLAQQISNINDLYIIAPISRRLDPKLGIKIKGITCYAIPTYKVALSPSNAVKAEFIGIISDISPDIIHIWGTEYVHSYSAVLACREAGLLDQTVISIRGMVSVYAKHYYGFVNPSTFPFSIFDFIRINTIRCQRNKFLKRGQYERKALQIAHHVIGRTDWDHACTIQINPKITYHFCNETLRNSFYSQSWKIEKCQRHSVFVSQSNYPIKGFHLVLEAVSILREKWPDIHVFTTGSLSRKPSIKENTYQRFIRRMIKRLGLDNNVTYLGYLNEEQMCDQYCKSHVFVSASSIENSPNSVGEAMLLGMPVISSDVGGVKNLLHHEIEGFIYQADAPYMLAYYIDKMFSNDQIAISLGEAAKERAKKTHDIEKNYDTLLAIYKTLEAGR